MIISKYYDDIVNFLYEEDDIISKTLISSYQEYVFKIKNKQSKQTIDNILYEYINKTDFYKYVQENFENLYSSYDKVVLSLKRLYNEYEIERLKNIKNARWL